MSKVLYISYDGMTDPLGQSQVIPYLQGLSSIGHKITLLSTEKEKRYNKSKEAINTILTEAGIEWIPLLYTKYPPVLSTIYDIYQLQNRAFKLYKQKGFDIVHCRSYISALIGLRMKQKYGTSFIFDMRGFWADERVDGGLWNLQNILYRSIYNYFKKKELQFLKNADYTISLTYNAKNEILQWPVFKNNLIPIEVIPCCADLNLFKPQPVETRTLYRRKLNIAEDEFLWVYLGSIGTWYMLDEMLAFFSTINTIEEKMKMLFITTEPKTMIMNSLSKFNIPQERVIILQAERKEVPCYLSASDGSLFFIMRTFSKIASSPVKHAEMLGSHLLLVTNSGIGDVDKIINETQTGIVISDFSMEAYKIAFEDFKQLKKVNKAQFDKALSAYYDLNEGIRRYNEVYKSCIQNKL